MQAAAAAEEQATDGKLLASVGECAICMDAPASHLVAPCGHQCMCAKCENYWNMLADCMGDARSMEENGASPDRPVKGWRLNHRGVA